jgi:hypothetical protein
MRNLYRHLVLGACVLVSMGSVGCGRGRHPDALSAGMDKNAIAKVIAGTWRNKYVGAVLPNGQKNEGEQDITFMLEPTRFHHGKFTRTNGGQGNWTVGEVHEESDGTYSGRMVVFDDRDGPAGVLANGGTKGKWEFSGLTKDRFIEEHPTGKAYEWKKEN